MPTMRSSDENAIKVFVGPENPITWSLSGDVCRTYPSCSSRSVMDFLAAFSPRILVDRFCRGKELTHLRQPESCRQTIRLARRNPRVLNANQHKNEDKEQHSHQVERNPTPSLSPAGTRSLMDSHNLHGIGMHDATGIFGRNYRGNGLALMQFELPKRDEAILFRRVWSCSV